MAVNPRVYCTAAFLAGVLLTLGFKDIYPDLEKRFRRRWRGNEIALEDSSLPGKIQLREGDTDGKEETGKKTSIGEGIESTIGKTPLFKIKSLSEATGCQILAKAEVRLQDIDLRVFPSTELEQFLNGAGQSPKDRVALSIIEKVKTL
jgi:cysteine synthase A